MRASGEDMGQSRRGQRGRGGRVSGEESGDRGLCSGWTYLVLLSHVQAEALVAAGDTKQKAHRLVHQPG